MEPTPQFRVMDCSLVRQATGRMCSNLRELLEAIRTVPEGVLEHHMMRCALDDHFALHEFPNDIARWCWTALGDNVLGEQLGLADPYRLPTTETLRSMLINVIEDRLWGLHHVPWCRPGSEFHLVESHLIAYDTGERVSTPAALLETIDRMSPRSLFYHVHDAHRRTEGRYDDFSVWLDQTGADPNLVAAVRKIDFYFLNLNQLRQALGDAFRQHIAVAPPVPRSTHEAVGPL